MVGSEVYSSEVKKTEVLMENFRRAIGEYLYIITFIAHTSQVSALKKSKKFTKVKYLN